MNEDETFQPPVIGNEIYVKMVTELTGNRIQLIVEFPKKNKAIVEEAIDALQKPDDARPAKKQK